jgi:hypothetical protein
MSRTSKKLCLVIALCAPLLSCEKRTAKFRVHDKVKVKLTDTKGEVALRMQPFVDDLYYLKVRESSWKFDLTFPSWYDPAKYEPNPGWHFEGQKAMAAAERARATLKGREYQNTFNASASLRDIMMNGIKECLPINAPGVRKAPGFQCVLIIGKTGKPKWIIRDSQDAMAQCFYAKLVKSTYPPPPADNWRVLFGINMPAR